MNIGGFGSAAAGLTGGYEDAENAKSQRDLNAARAAGIKADTDAKLNDALSHKETADKLHSWGFTDFAQTVGGKSWKPPVAPAMTNAGGGADQATDSPGAQDAPAPAAMTGASTGFGPSSGLKTPSPPGLVDLQALSSTRGY